MAVAAARFRVRLAGEPDPTGAVRPHPCSAAKPGGHLRAGRPSAEVGSPRSSRAERGAVDCVIVGLLFMGGLRHSEAVELEWRDVTDARVAGLRAEGALGPPRSTSSTCAGCWTSRRRSRPTRPARRTASSEARARTRAAIAHHAPAACSTKARRWKPTFEPHQLSPRLWWWAGSRALRISVTTRCARASSPRKIAGGAGAGVRRAEGQHGSFDYTTTRGGWDKRNYE